MNLASIGAISLADRLRDDQFPEQDFLHRRRDRDAQSRPAPI